MTLFIQSALSFLEICIFDSKKIYEYKKCKPKSLNLEISKFLMRNKKLKMKVTFYQSQSKVPIP